MGFLVNPNTYKIVKCFPFNLFNQTKHGLTKSIEVSTKTRFKLVAHKVFHIVLYTLKQLKSQ